MAENKYR
jgi:hypothetical protein